MLAEEEDKARDLGGQPTRPMPPAELLEPGPKGEAGGKEELPTADGVHSGSDSFSDTTTNPFNTVELRAHRHELCAAN